MESNNYNETILEQLKLNKEEQIEFDFNIENASIILSQRFTGDNTPLQTFNNLSLQEYIETFYPISSVQRLYQAFRDQGIASVIKNDLRFYGRVDQIPPDDFSTYVMIMGRGGGKSATGAGYLVHAHMHLNVKSSAVIGRTMTEAKNVFFRAIFKCCPPHFMPKTSGNKLLWPGGGITYFFSAEEPDSIRGANIELMVCDEISSWSYIDSYDQANLTLREGNPRKLILSTPKNNDITKMILNEKDIMMIRGSSFNNRKLPLKFFQTILSKYQRGSHLYRQEVLAELVEDNLDALFTKGEIDKSRVTSLESYQEQNENGTWFTKYKKKQFKFRKVIVAVDPAVTENEESDETGLVVWGIGTDGKHYILHSEAVKCKPREYMEKAVKLYHKFNARVLIVETNNGGDTYESILRMIDPSVLYKKYFSKVSKLQRLQPSAGLMQAGLLHFIDYHAALEDELCKYDGSGDSPNLLDAMAIAGIEACEELGYHEIITDVAKSMIDRQEANKKLSSEGKEQIKTGYELAKEMLNNRKNQNKIIKK